MKSIPPPCCRSPPPLLLCMYLQFASESLYALVPCPAAIAPRCFPVRRSCGRPFSLSCYYRRHCTAQMLLPPHSPCRLAPPPPRPPLYVRSSSSIQEMELRVELPDNAVDCRYSPISISSLPISVTLPSVANENLLTISTCFLVLAQRVSICC